MPNLTETIWSVSALNFEIKTMLEKGIGSIWIEGEISNFTQPASGHWYFSLKDERAQIRAAMFRNRNNRAPFTPRNGQQVLVRGQVTLYEARGDYQIIIDHLEEIGTGRLMRQFEVLKKKLSEEGLFADSRKKTVPAQAAHIGIVTSTSGAAIRDAISVIRRRSPTTRVTVFATAVQGEQASSQIVDALNLANRFGKCDVLLLIRGGGSLEDLWCFNDENVARAIGGSGCPVVTGIGHEIDFTIADFVADLRAPTPSVAAESVTMDQYEMMSALDLLQARLQRSITQSLQTSMEETTRLQHRLLTFHPQRQLSSLTQRLEFVQQSLRGQIGVTLMHRQNRVQLLLESIKQRNPNQKIPHLMQHIDSLHHQLLMDMRYLLQQKKQYCLLQTQSLDNLSPLKTLARGYAAIQKNEQIISSVNQLEAGDEIEIQLTDGQRQARII